MIIAHGIQKSFGGTNVLAGVSFALGDGQRGALVGQNGTGKSTILKILAGLIPADGGDFTFGPTASVGYLPQELDTSGDPTIIGHIRREVGIDRIEAELDRWSSRLDTPEGQEAYARAMAEYERRHGYTFDIQAASVLSGFGLQDIPLDQPVTTLSGGQKSKVSLAALLLRRDDVVLLDEPTNNLDLPALSWLEAFLKASPATALIVSHDRRFVDRIADKVIELDWRTRTATVTAGTYTDYLDHMAKQRARQQLAYREQQEEISRLSGRAEQLKRKAQRGSHWMGTDNDKFLRGFKRDRASGSARGAKAIEKRIQQMDQIEKPFERDPLEIDIGSELGSGSRNIDLVEAIAGYPSGFQVGPLSLHIPFGQHVALLGLNGSGKSTILRTIAGDRPPISGRVSVGSGVRMGELLQEHEHLERNTTPLAFIAQRLKLEDEAAYNLLHRAGVWVEHALRDISELSPGIRARTLIALFSGLQTNTLLLDEPTNHLDLEAMEALEQALQGFKGTILAVAHDRYFLSKLHWDRVFRVSEGALVEIEDLPAYLDELETRAGKMVRQLGKL